MLKYIIKRLLYAIFTLWVVVTITFILMMGVPGNPIAGEKNLPPAVMENLKKHYKLDQPLSVQYVNYLKSVVKFDFGPSMKFKSVQVRDYITRGFPVSMQLGLQALLVAIIFGVSLGIIASLNHNKMIDYLASVVAILGVSVPGFVLGRMLIIVFSTKLGWLSFGKWTSFEYTILPTIALSALPLAQIERLTRSSMLEVMGQDYIRTAKAKGVKRNAIIIKHALRNAILPIISILGTVATNLITGSFVIERIFAVPGMGDLLVKSVENRDYPIIIASTVVYSAALVIIILIVDISYFFIDPRIKLSGGGKIGK